MKKTSRWDQRGQNIAEYAILFAVVIAAFAAMQVYAKRGLQARIKSGTDALTSITTTIQAPTGATGTGGGTGGTGGAGGTGGGTPAITPATFAAQAQYEPYYLESSGNVYTENVEKQHMGGGKVVLEKVSDVTVRQAGTYQRQKGASNRLGAEALWNETTSGNQPSGNQPSGNQPSGNRPPGS